MVIEAQVIEEEPVGEGILPREEARTPGGADRHGGHGGAEVDALLGERI